MVNSGFFIASAYQVERPWGLPKKCRARAALSSTNRVERITPRARPEETGTSFHLMLAQTPEFDHKPAPSRSLVSGFARLRLARAALRFRVPLFALRSW